MVYYHHVRLGKHMVFWKIINLGCIWILWFPAHFRKLMWELLFTSLASQSRSSHLPLLKHSSGRKFFRQEHNRGIDLSYQFLILFFLFFLYFWWILRRVFSPWHMQHFSTSILREVEVITHLIRVSFQRRRLLVIQSWGIYRERWCILR